MDTEQLIVVNPLKMRQPASIGLLSEAARLPTSTEYFGANPMLDEWIMLARAIIDVMTVIPA